MPVSGKVGPSLGDILKRGLAELQNTTIAFPAPSAPTMER